MNKGIMFILTFDILSAAQSVWLASLLQGIHVYNILLINFAIITIVFFTLHLFKRKISAQGKFTFPNILLFVALNIATLGSWLFLYISLRYMEPALTAATLYGINPLATILMNLLLWRNIKQLTPAKIIVSLLTVFCMLIVGITVSTGQSSLTAMPRHELLYGFLMAIMTGFCMAAVNVVSKKIYDNGFTLYQLMSMRFFLLLIVSAYLSKSVMTDLPMHIGAFLIIALLGNVIPLFMLQKGIALIPSVQVSYLLLLTPLFVFVFQFFDSRLNMSVYSLAAILSVIFLSYLGSRVENKQQRE